MKELTITNLEAEQRMDKYLKRVFPKMGTGFLYKMLRKKNITLNGKKATGSELLKIGDAIQCFFSDETFSKFSDNGECVLSDNNLAQKFLASDNTEYQRAFISLQGVSIIYEDEHLLLLYKPVGVLSQKAKPEDVSLNEWMIGYLLDKQSITTKSLNYFKPSVCNRLDRNTSGLVICGKTLPASREMSRILKNRSLHKYYRTYVHGMLNDSKVLEGYHYKDKGNNRAEILFNKPKQNEDRYDSIITAYRSLETNKEFTYLEIELITGKTHQIRAHLAAFGYPIVGDKKYNTKQVIKTGNYPNHQLLHAYRIVFPRLEGMFSYLSKKEFICNEPEDFYKFRNDYWV